MPSRSVLWLVFAIAVAAAGCGAKAPHPGSSPASKPRKAVGLRGQVVGVGGHSLYFECVGRGSPTVLLEAGLGGDGRGWSAVQPALGATTRTCSYDRAGLGNSSPIPGVHDADDEIHDLEVLLSRAEIRPPYVLVGHSYGGLLVRLFASRHPQETAGVVLIDSIHPEQARRMAQALSRARVPPAFRRNLAVPLVVDGLALRRSLALGRRVVSLGHTRLVVITAGEFDPVGTSPPQVDKALGRTWLALQNDLAALSRDHVHVVALDSDHFVQGASGQPDVVIRGVLSVVRAARAQRGLRRCAETFRGIHGVRCL